MLPELGGKMKKESQERNRNIQKYLETRAKEHSNKLKIQQRGSTTNYKKEKKGSVTQKTRHLNNPNRAEI